MMNLRYEIVSLVRNEVASTGRDDLFRDPLVGFAAAEDPLFEQLKKIVGPHHLHPQEMLPGAKTVVAFFIPFTKTVVASNRRTKQVSRLWAVSYLLANGLINRIADKIVQELDSLGIKGATVKATHNFDQKTLAASWSHRSAAFIAGLGRFGVNRMLITPAGGAGRYGSVIIAAELPPDRRPEGEFCTHLKHGECNYCVEACPTGALTVEGLDKQKCYRHLLEVGREFADLGLCDVCGKCVVGPCALL